MSHKKRREKKKRKRERSTGKKKLAKRDSLRQRSVNVNREPLKFFSVEAPFCSLPAEESLKAFQEAGQQYADQFDKLLPKLQSLIVQTNPLALLGMASVTTLMRPLDKLEEFTDEGKYFLSHLELLQAFVLRNPASSFTHAFVESQHLTEVMDCVRDLGRCFAFKRMAQVSPETPKETRGAMAISEQFRVHTQDVRNDGYISQMHRVYRELLAPLDADFVRAFGVTAQGLVNCFFGTNQIFNDRYNAHLIKCEPAINSQSAVEAVEKYADSYNLTSAQRAGMHEFVQRNGIDGDDLRAHLIWQTFNNMFPLFIWSVDDWLALMGDDGNADAIAAMFDKLSLGPGELSAIDPEHLFMGNPVWTQPLIPIDEKRIFLACPGAPLSHCLDIVSFLIDDLPELKSKYLSRRGKFLESTLYSLIRKSLPSAKLFPGSLWRAEDSSEGENDLLAVVNGVALVFEAKAGTIHATARRGATLRLQDAVSKIVVDASTQAHAFIEFLKEAKGAVTLRTSQGGSNHIDPRTIDTFIPIAVSLDQLASEFLCWSMLAETATIPVGARPVVATSLWDLELVTEILDEEHILLHYLARRYAIEQNTTYFGDELDLLVLYLDTGFDIPPGTQNSPLQLGHLSNRLNPYFMGKEEGVTTAKPTRKLTRWWRNIVAAVWGKQTVESREAAFALLDVAIQQQEEIGREFEKLKRYVRSNSSNARIQDSLAFETGAGLSRYCVVLIAIGDAKFAKTKEELHDYMAGTARQALSEFPACNYAMILAVHVDLHSLPYSVFALIHRDAWK